MPPAGNALNGGGGAASKKRKLGGDGDGKQVKYYAVRAGKTPGVYTNWEDCKNNTYGFRGAVCKFCGFFSVTLSYLWWKGVFAKF